MSRTCHRDLEVPGSDHETREGVGGHVVYRRQASARGRTGGKSAVFGGHDPEGRQGGEQPGGVEMTSQCGIFARLQTEDLRVDGPKRRRESVGR